MALAERFEQELGRRAEFASGMEIGTKALAEVAVAQIYQLLGKPAPAVVWCQSLYQMATMPSLMVGMFFSDAWQIVSCGLANRYVDEHWESDYEQGWEALWAHGGQQLLKGMKQTSRISQQYWQLEAALFQQCKNELRTWLKSGKIHEFEQRLPKETIYRKFWGLQLWHLNFVQDRLRLLSAQLNEQLLEESYSWGEQWQQFAPYQERLRTIYNGCNLSLGAIINRMGAEPANQLKHCVWLPVALPETTLCQIWQENVHRAAFPNYAEEILAWNRLANCTLGVICLDHVVFACEKTLQFTFDVGGRIHSPSGPALTFADGFVEHAWHGVSVDARIIEEPDSISIDEIDAMRNAELRRVLVERYGEARYLQDSGAEEMQQDDFGTLYKKEIEGDEALVMVKVVNSSPEPDGTFKDYFLRVPPDVETAQQAVAWTFGIDPDDYAPLRET